MKATMLAAAVAAALAIAVPAQADASHYAGVVVAKQAQRGTLVLAGRDGIGLTVRVSPARARVGDRVDVEGSRLCDDTVRASRLAVRAHTTTATIRGVVLKQLRSSTLVATGRSVITVRHAVGDDALGAGRAARFALRIDDHGGLTERSAAAIAAPAGSVSIEGKVVSVSPFVVSLEGLPVTITVPAGATLPAALAAGERIELTVLPSAGNVFTLISIDEIENAPAAANEVEVRGLVLSSTGGRLVVATRGMTFTFAAPANALLPVLPVGTRVEARGVMVNGVLTLVRVKVEDDGGGDGGDGGGHHGGD